MIHKFFKLCLLMHTTVLQVNIISKISLIGMPYCYWDYNASTAINEINKLDSNCLTIERVNSTNNQYELFSLNSSFDYSIGIKKDFPLKQDEAYFVGQKC